MTEPRTNNGFWQRAKKVALGVLLILGVASSASAVTIKSGDIHDVFKGNKGKINWKTARKKAWKFGQDGENKARQARQKERNAAKKQEDLKNKAIKQQTIANTFTKQAAILMHQADSAWVLYEEAANTALDNPNSKIAQTNGKDAFTTAKNTEKTFRNILKKADDAGAKAANMFIQATGSDPYAQARIDEQVQRQVKLEAREVARQSELQKLADKEEALNKKNAQNTRKDKKANTYRQAAPQTTSGTATQSNLTSSTGPSAIRKTFNAASRWTLKKMGVPLAPIVINVNKTVPAKTPAPTPEDPK